MSNEKQSGQGQTEYDINQTLGYTGPSFRQMAPIADGIALFDYRNTDDNERKICTLLSSQGIPFNIERRSHGWGGAPIRMIVTVPVAQHLQADAILRAAAGASVVEIVEGTAGLSSRWGL